MSATNSNFDKRNLERQRHWQGEGLRAGDFNDQSANDAQLRWWHNRAVHNAYGVADGFEVRRAANTVKVSAGIAYDMFGRELVLLHDRDFDLTDKADMTLLVRYNADAKTRQGACRASRGEAELVWKQSSEVRVVDGVPLAYIKNIEASESIVAPVTDSLFRLRRTTTEARPRIVTGSTVPRGTAWQSWVNKDQELTYGLKVKVDTTAGGFVNIPLCLFAWLQWPATTNETDEQRTFRYGLQAKLQFTEYVTDVTTDSFLFRIRPQQEHNRLTQILKTMQVHVYWLAIESVLKAYPMEASTHV